MKLDKKELMKELNSEFTEEFLNMLTDEERRVLLDVLASESRIGRNYHRVLSRQEKSAISTDAYGFLMGLVHIGSLTSRDMESVLSSCVSIAEEWKIVINKERMDRIVTIYLFTGIINISSDGYLEMVNGGGENNKN
ncbi:MAG: DUF494 family protein [Candidatus Cloacimonetes bacterium]|nr:DUF494 family protein [Candidatus Cloacimonadota bacterium]